MRSNWWIDGWDRRSSAIDENADQTVEVAMLLPDEVVARALEDEMEMPGYEQRCHRRGCGHAIARHDSTGCTAVGCDCEGAKP